MSGKIINNINLKVKEYDIKTLEDNVSRLSKVTLLMYQTLTPEFCVKYILKKPNSDNVNDDYDDDICIEEILECQPHIMKDALLAEIVNQSKIKTGFSKTKTTC
jgi:hypothetical protein